MVFLVQNVCNLEIQLVLCQLAASFRLVNRPEAASKFDNCLLHLAAIIGLIESCQSLAHAHAGLLDTLALCQNGLVCNDNAPLLKCWSDSSTSQPLAEPEEWLAVLVEAWKH